MVKKTPTKLRRQCNADDVGALVRWMGDTYKVSIVDKATAPEMKLAAAVLEALGVLDGAVFLRDYSTYLFGKVYLPWKPGSTTNLGGEIVTIAHEYGHAFQDQRAGRGLEFEVDYLDTAKRAVIEAECYALGACLAIRYPTAFTSAPSQVALAILAFRSGYGSIPVAHVNKFAAELNRRVDEYRLNGQPFNLHLRRVTNLLDRRLVRRHW